MYTRAMNFCESILRGQNKQSALPPPDDPGECLVPWNDVFPPSSGFVQKEGTCVLVRSPEGSDEDDADGYEIALRLAPRQETFSQVQDIRHSAESYVHLTTRPIDSPPKPPEGELPVPPCWPKWSPILLRAYRLAGHIKLNWPLTAEADERRFGEEQLGASDWPQSNNSETLKAKPASGAVQTGRATRKGTKPKIVVDTRKTPSSSKPPRHPTQDIARQRRAQLSHSSSCFGCPTCPGKGSTVSKCDDDDLRRDICGAFSRAVMPDDELISPEMATCMPELGRLRELVTACSPYVQLVADNGIRFRKDLACRCFDWQHLFGSKVPGQPHAHASLQHFEISIEIGDIFKCFDLFPYGSSTASSSSIRRQRQSAQDKEEVDYIFGERRCYFECLRLLNRSVWNYDNDYMNAVRKLSPTTAIYVTLLKAMTSVKVELLYRIKKQTTVELPRDALEHPSSRYSLEAAAATFAWLARSHCLDNIVAPTQKFLHPIYEATIADLYDDCCHLDALLAILPDRFACLCCEVCESKSPSSRDNFNGDGDKGKMFFRDAPHLLDTFVESVHSSPSEAIKGRRMAFLHLAIRVVDKKLREDLATELDMIGKRDPLAYHLVQLKRRGMADATETNEVVDDVYRAVKPRHIDSMFEGDLLGKILFS